MADRIFIAPKHCAPLERDHTFVYKHSAQTEPACRLVAAQAALGNLRTGVYFALAESFPLEFARNAFASSISGLLISAWRHSTISFA